MTVKSFLCFHHYQAIYVEIYCQKELVNWEGLWSEWFKRRHDLTNWKIRTTRKTNTILKTFLKSDPGNFYSLRLFNPHESYAIYENWDKSNIPGNYSAPTLQERVMIWTRTGMFLSLLGAGMHLKRRFVWWKITQSHFRKWAVAPYCTPSSRLPSAEPAGNANATAAKAPNHQKNNLKKQPYQFMKIQQYIFFEKQSFKYCPEPPHLPPPWIWVNSYQDANNSCKKASSTSKCLQSGRLSKPNPIEP